MTITSPQELIAVKLQQIQDAETEASRVLNEIKGHRDGRAAGARLYLTPDYIPLRQRPAASRFRSKR